MLAANIVLYMLEKQNVYNCIFLLPYVVLLSYSYSILKIKLVILILRQCKYGDLKC